ncbi:hypothetical protein FNV43_RR16898 [Rhamnella rubrinervis]|uniref:Uncharacterized protein n=1 Tax=Rhamnella rubrinervis TaxID=2594499 RepID=A0A8K0GZP8_9ROSA|nr:hypothetical protein FNV43_RR16898 [Rhamnella rubrinervis]
MIFGISLYLVVNALLSYHLGVATGLGRAGVLLSLFCSVRREFFHSVSVLNPCYKKRTKKKVVVVVEADRKRVKALCTTSSSLSKKKRRKKKKKKEEDDEGWREIRKRWSLLGARLDLRRVISGYDPESICDQCMCSRSSRGEADDEFDMGDEECSTSEEEDMSFCIGDDEIRTKRSHSFEPQIVLELLSLANKFCCDEMKSVSDAHLASLVCDMESAVMLIDYGLEENASLLVAACLHVFLRELPNSLHTPHIMRHFCSSEAREKLAMVGHASFVLYYFLSQIAMEEDMKSNTTVMLLERLGECASDNWQKQLAFHELGVVMLERREYKDASRWFGAAAEAGHTYSLVGVARAKYLWPHVFCIQADELSAFYCTPVGWMHQERSLCCIGKEKMMDF